MLFYFKIFQRKPAFAHFGEHEKKAINLVPRSLRCLYKMKQSHWFQCVVKNCDWSGKITTLSDLTRASLGVEWELTAKAEYWAAKYANLKENAGYIESVFVIRAAQRAEVFGCCFKYCRKWKNRLGKLAIAVNLEPIRFEFWTERSVSDGGNLCPLWLVILKSVWYSVG